MYKLEPVLADGGELIIYAPHIREVSVTHGRTLLEVGYHCRDYFLKQWDRFQQYPWGVLAHSTHVYGLGTFENGLETPRARVVLATSIPEAVCRKINLGYRDPKTIRPEDFAGREEEGVLLVPKAGEMLFQLKNPPAWAGARCRDEAPMKKPAALPFVFVNVAMTADGKIAPANRHFEPFGGPRDRQHLLELRATADAVMSGARTMDLDRVNLGPGPARYRRLRLRRGLAEYNLRVIVSGAGTIDPQAEIFKHRFSPIIILTTGRIAKSRLARLRAAGGRGQNLRGEGTRFLRSLALVAREMESQAFALRRRRRIERRAFPAGLVDEVHLTLCPIILGGRAAPTLADGAGVAKLADAARFRLASMKRSGSVLFLVYRRNGLR